jgi:tetratricopeptide (TPR) repeat protein
MYNPAREEQRERDLRYRLEHDPYEEHQLELEPAERIADQASLPPGHPIVLAAARHRLGRGPSPYEQPHQPEIGRRTAMVGIFPDDRSLIRRGAPTPNTTSWDLTIRAAPPNVSRSSAQSNAGSIATDVGSGQGQSFAELAQSGDRHLAAGEYAAATKAFRAAADVAETQRRQAWALHSAAVALRRHGAVDEALETAGRAREILHQAKEGGGQLAEVTLTVGNTLADAGRPREAVPVLRLAMELFREVDAPLEETQAQISLGRALAEDGRDQEATDLFEGVERDGMHPMLRSQVLNNLALLRQRNEDVDGAIGYLREDLALVRRVGDSYGEVVTRINLAGALRQGGNASEARVVLHEAQRLAARLDAPALTDRIEATLSELDSR